MPPSNDTKIDSSQQQWIIVCDFDGTISLEDVTDALLERFAHCGWRELEAAWQAGRIGSAVCMAGQIALLDVSHAELLRFCDGIAIDADFPAFFAATMTSSVALCIASDGLDLVIKRVLQKQQLDSLPLISNQLLECGPSRWQLDMPFRSADCRVASGTCKCAAVARLRRGWSRVLLIGDGTSDFCVARQADHVLAKGRLAAHCRTNGIVHTPMTNFADALRLLPRLDPLHPQTVFKTLTLDETRTP